jgi:hypothetical protein
VVLGLRGCTWGLKHLSAKINMLQKLDRPERTYRTQQYKSSECISAPEDGGSLVIRKVGTYQTTKKTPWPLVRKRTIPTERPPHVDEI